VGDLKHTHDAPSVTHVLEAQEDSWEQHNNLSESQRLFLEAQENLSDRISRVVSQQKVHFEQQLRQQKNNTKSLTIPYLEPYVPEIEINRLDSGGFEAKVVISGVGDTTSSAIRDLMLTTFKILEELI